MYGTKWLWLWYTNKKNSTVIYNLRSGYAKLNDYCHRKCKLSMWRKGNRWTVYSSLWPIWRSKIKTNSWHVFIVWLNAPQFGGAPYSRSRWRSFTNGNETDSTSSGLYTGNQTLRFIIYLLFSTVIILFIFISVSTYQKYNRDAANRRPCRT